MADSNHGFSDDVNTVPAEDGSTWVEIASVGTEDEASLVQGFLEAEGIPAQIESVRSDVAPANFLKLLDFPIEVGDELELKGSRSETADGSTVFLVHEMKKRKVMVNVRDPEGKPLW